MSNTHTFQRIRIWDLPTRAFHILLIVCVAGLFITGEVGGDALSFHFWFGYAVLTLLLFRILWGFVGGHWSRFLNFVPSPATFLAYVRSLRAKESTHNVGHNPFGALSVLVMLSILLLQVFSGFMSDDEIAFAGPWARLVSGEWVELATEYHTEIGKVVVIFLICFHIAAVVYHNHIKKDDLISPMIHGDKALPAGTHDSRDTLTSRLFAFSLLVGCAYVVYRLVQLG